MNWAGDGQEHVSQIRHNFFQLADLLVVGSFMVVLSKAHGKNWIPKLVRN
jgi:hypothetical protein